MSGSVFLPLKPVVVEVQCFLSADVSMCFVVKKLSSSLNNITSHGLPNGKMNQTLQEVLRC